MSIGSNDRSRRCLANRAANRYTLRMDLQAFIQDEVTRRKAFPVTGQCVFLGHAGVAPLPRATADLMREFLDRASHHRQEGAWTETWVEASRRFAAELLGAEPGRGIRA